MELRLKARHSCVGVPAMEVLNGMLEIMQWYLGITASQALKDCIMNEDILILGSITQKRETLN